MGLRGIAILAVAAAFLSSPASAALVSLGKDACQGSCNRCEGDCDRDSDCSGSLRCFMRDGTQAVPGCSSDGEGNGSWDYCYDDDGGGSSTTLTSTNLNGCGSVGCNQCEGDCDNDSDCKGSLICSFRNAEQAIPGCSGTGISAWDYCVPSSSPSPPTRSPTSNPTKRPTTTGVGNNLYSTSVGGCGSRGCEECEGDCDSDADCQGSLTCFNRNALEFVPGCGSGGMETWDYCIRSSSPSTGQINSIGKDACSSGSCNLCEGDCDSDSDCNGSLRCYQRNTNESVPGCTGNPYGAWDYCYDTDAPPPAPAPPTRAPTRNPTRAPTPNNSPNSEVQVKYDGHECRNTNGGVGTERICQAWTGGDYYEKAGWTYNECETFCRGDSTCVAVEYDNIRMHCEIWTTYPFSQLQRNEYQCNKFGNSGVAPAPAPGQAWAAAPAPPAPAPDVYYNNYECKTSNGGDGTLRTCTSWGTGDYYTLTLAEDDCFNYCENDNDCKAFEFKYLNGATHCKIWTTYPGNHSRKDGSDCYKKEEKENSSECLCDNEESEYRGTVATTISGRTCQRWDSQSPHVHTRTPSNYPNGGLGNHNYCRNPDGWTGLWCYTTDSNTRWELCDVPCYKRDQSEYRGSNSVTVSGRTCQRWDSQSPHAHTRTPGNYPNGGLESNHCRNPDGDKALWCHTTDPNKFWEYCDTPSCPTKKRDCMCAADGSDYRGEVRLTVSGKECQRWDVQSPHTHTMTPSNYPNAGLASNYCRNPGGAMSGPYCYTTDPNTPFELCDIPSCGSDGSEYRGTLATTRSGRTCQRWDSQSPHTHTRTPANYPRGDLAGNNYCRNPDGDKGLWCHTTDPNVWWERCDNPACPDTQDNGAPYTG